MVGLKKITIDNFQSHGHTEITFGPGLNVIIGPSDMGKSAIIRALRWVLYNEPRGADFIRSGENYCQVRVELTDGTSIERLRSPSKNRYTLNRTDGAELVFEGFGTAVPAEITAAHGMPPVYLDADTTEPLNFGYQLDGPFLLSAGGATKAKAIGRLSGVHIIDAAIRTLLRDLAGNQQEEKRLEETAAGLAEKLAAYSDLPETAARLQRSDVIARDLAEKNTRADRLQVYREKWDGLTADVTATRRLTAALSGLPQAEQQLSSALAKNALAQRLAAARDRLAALQSEQEKLAAVLAQTASLPAAETLYHRGENRFRRQQQLVRLRDSRRNNTANRAAAAAILQRTAAVASAAAGLDQIASLLGRLQKIAALRRKWVPLKRELDAQTAVCRRLAALPAAEELSRKLTVRLDRKGKLANLAAAWRENAKNRAAGQAYLSRLAAETEQRLRSYRAMLAAAGRCPFCYNRIDNAAIDRIMAEMAKEGESTHAG